MHISFLLHWSHTSEAGCPGICSYYDMTLALYFMPESAESIVGTLLGIFLTLEVKAKT